MPVMDAGHSYWIQRLNSFLQPLRIPTSDWPSILALRGSRFARSWGTPNAIQNFVRLLALFTLLLVPLPNRARPAILRIPFRNVQTMILVDGKVNGNPAIFLVDTGADRTVVSARVYGNVLLKMQQLRRNRHGAGVSGASVTLTADLALAHRLWTSQRVSVMNLDELNESLKLHIDGLIGQDILREFRYVRIDYHTHTIELEE